MEDKVILTVSQVVKILQTKGNWSTHGLDRPVSYWWKRAHVLHEDVSKAFQAIMGGQPEYPLWFSAGKTSLIPKPGKFSSDNQRPITCLNSVY